MPITEALMGLGDLTDEQKQQVLAQKLRGQKSAADLLSMSTLKPLAMGGATRSSQVMDAAQQAGTLRQRGLTRAAQVGRETQAQENWKAEQEWKKSKLLQELESKEKVAALKKTTKFRNLTRLDKSKMGDMADNYLKQKELTKNFKDEYATLAIPFARQGLSAIGGVAPALVSENAKAARDWYGAQSLYHDTIVRHKYFGSQFTVPEMKKWKEMAVSQGEDAAQTRLKLDRQAQFLKPFLKRYEMTQMADNVNPEVLDANFAEIHKDIFGQSGSIVDLYQPALEGMISGEAEEPDTIANQVENQATGEIYTPEELSLLPEDELDRILNQ